MFKLRPKALILGLLCAAFLGIVALGAVLHGFSRAASLAIQQNPQLSETDHNAIKHAYAAAEMYSLLRPLFGAERAAETTIWLGEANERAERYVKFTQDWSPEVYKDLRNNLSGVEAGEWLYGQAGFTSPFTRLAMIGKLAEWGILAPLETDPRIPRLPQEPDTETAIVVMQADEAKLRVQLRGEIAARTDDLRAALGL